MAKVIAHVIAAEGKHGHRIAADFSDLAGCCCRHLRSHRGAHINARTPVKRLVDERDCVGTPTTEYDRADWDPGWIFPRRIYGGALSRGSRKAGVRVRGFGPGFLGNFWCPAIALPINALCGRLN